MDTLINVPFDLAPELVVLIFSHAVASSPIAAQTLSRVSRWARELAMPRLWSTLVIRDRTAALTAEQQRALCYSLENGATLFSKVPTVDEIPEDAWGYFHNFSYVVDSPGVGALGSRRLSESQILARSLLLHALPHLKRLAVSFHILEYLIRASTRTRPSAGDAPYAHSGPLSPSPYRVQELFVHSSMLDSLGSVALGTFGSLTHLRVGMPLSPDAQDNSHLGVEITHPLRYLPSLTHYAFEHHGPYCSQKPDIQDPAVDTDEPDEGRLYWDDVFDKYIEALLGKGELHLKCVLVLVRSTTEPTVAQSILRDLAARHAKDSRILSLEIAALADHREDWRLWESLAKDDRSIWDFAVERSRR